MYGVVATDDGGGDDDSHARGRRSVEVGPVVGSRGNELGKIRGAARLGRFKCARNTRD